MNENLLKGQGLLEVQLTARDSWLWKCTVRVAQEFCTQYEEKASILGLEGSALAALERPGKHLPKLAYEVLRGRGEAIPWGEMIWVSQQCKRWSFITWLAAQDRLHTRARLFKWNAIQAQDCVLCGAEVEDRNHLWFECAYSRGVVDIVMKWLGVTVRFPTIQGWLSWFAEGDAKKTAMFQSRLYAITSVIYNIWRARNLAILRNTYMRIEETAGLIVHECKERLRVKGRSTSRVDRTWRERLIA